MVLGSALLTSNDAVAKWLSQELPVAQVWCLRAVSATALILLLAPRYGGYACLRPRSWRAQGVRASLFVVTTALIVWGLSLLPLVEMSSILFAGPIFVVVLSVWLLGERVGMHRWLGVAIGFAGVLLILRPGAAVFGLGALVALGAALTGALRDVVTRRLGATEHPLAILNVSNSAVLLIGLAIAPWAGWLWPTHGAWLLLGLNGVLNAGAHLLIIESLRVAEASAVAPYKYTALLWSVIFSVLVFAHVPGPGTIAGALLVVAGGLYILRREQRAAAALARASPR